MSAKSLRTERQRALRARFRSHEQHTLNLLENPNTPKAWLDDKIELLERILDNITATLENAHLREDLAELKARVADRGKPVPTSGVSIVCNHCGDHACFVPESEYHCDLFGKPATCPNCGPGTFGVIDDDGESMVQVYPKSAALEKVALLRDRAKYLRLVN